VRQCRDTSDLDAIMCRLRTAGPLVEHLRGLRAVMSQSDYPTTTVDREIEGASRRLGQNYDYEESDYDRDRAALKAAYLAEAAEMGAQVFDRMEDVVAELRSAYLVEGSPRLTELAQAVRDWLPFVSICPYITLLDEGSAPDPEPTPDLDTVPPLSPLARMHDEGPPAPTIREVREAMKARFEPWRGVADATDQDPRRKVLARSQAADDIVLRNVLYTDHPVLLAFPKVTSPREMEDVLTAWPELRDHRLQNLVVQVVTDLEDTVRAFRAELEGGHDPDWNRLEPLLLWAEGRLLEDEPPDSFLRGLARQFRQEVKPWTPADVLTLGCLVVAIAITAASMGVGGVALVALTAADFVIGAASLAATVYLTIEENEVRRRLNRFEHVDAALAVAAAPGDVGLMLVLGLLSLGIGGGAVVAVTRRAAVSAAARRAAALEHQAGAGEALAARAAREAPTAPAARPPATATPEAPAPRIVDDAAEHAEAPGSSTAARRGDAPDPELVLGPRLEARASRPFLDETEAFADDLADLRAAYARSREMGVDPQMVDDLAEFQATIERTATRLDAVVEITLASGDDAIAAGSRGVSTVADELEELRKALELGLARLALRDPKAWMSLAAGARASGGEESLAALNRATVRGTARLKNIDPDRAVALEPATAAQARRLRERSLAGSREAARDPRARIDSSERATSNPAELRGTRFTGSTRQNTIGNRGTVRSSGAPGEPIIVEDGLRISDFDLNTARTGGIEKIVVARSYEDGARASITIEGRVMPQRIERLNFNASDKLMGNRDLGLQVGEYELAHAWGAGFGDEAAPGIANAPRVINQLVQNRYIEQWIRRMARTIDAEGGRVRLRVEATTWATDRLPTPLRGGDFLKRVTYQVEVRLPGRPAARVRISVYAGRPPDNVIDNIEFDDAMLAGLRPDDLQAYRRFLFTPQTDELREIMERSAAFIR
jgi:hypothetical protein